VKQALLALLAGVALACGVKGPPRPHGAKTPTSTPTSTSTSTPTSTSTDAAPSNRP
jgi:hypothetical protein